MLRIRCFSFEFDAFLSNSVQRYFEFDASVSSSMQVFRIRGCSFEFGVIVRTSLLHRYFEFGSVPSNPVLFFFRMRCRQSDTGIGRFEFYAVPSRSIDADDAFNSNSMKFGGCFSFEIKTDAGCFSNATQNFELTAVHWNSALCQCSFVRLHSPSFFGIQHSTSDGSSSMDCV